MTESYNYREYFSGRRCAYCGEPFNYRHPAKKYCDVTCRVRAYRSRKYRRELMEASYDNPPTAIEIDANGTIRLA